MTLEEEIKNLSNCKYDFSKLVFQLQGAINTLYKLEVGFEVKEISLERKSDIIEALEFLVWYFNCWCSDWEDTLGERPEEY